MTDDELASKAKDVMFNRCWGISAEPRNIQSGINFFPRGVMCSQAMHIYLVKNGFSTCPWLSLVEGDKWASAAEVNLS